MIDRAQAMRLRSEGCTYQRIADVFGTSKQAVHQLLRYVPTGKPPGRPRLYSPEEAKKRKAEWRRRRAERRTRLIASEHAR